LCSILLDFDFLLDGVLETLGVFLCLVLLVAGFLLDEVSETLGVFSCLESEPAITLSRSDCSFHVL
jgi:hypothetical protein